MFVSSAAPNNRFHSRLQCERNRIFYLALPPSVFEPVTQNIRIACMSKARVPVRPSLLPHACSRATIG